MPKKKICKLCGQEFIPNYNAQRYCDNIHYKDCVVCGNRFEINWVNKDKQTCSTKCAELLRERTMVKRFGVPFSQQSEELQKKKEQTNLKRYGVKHAAQSDLIKEKSKQIFREKYGVDWPVQANWFQEKCKQTCLNKYGVEYTSQIPGRNDKMQKTNLERYGSVAPIGSKEVRSKAALAYKNNPSSLEKRLHAILNEYKIVYETEYIIQGETFTHSFDLYIPEYKILIDCDGSFYHGYLDDPDGLWVLPENDIRRLELVPEGTKFLIIQEDDFERGLNQLLVLITQKLDIFNYEGEIFTWCRSIDFPYPNYSDSRLLKDYAKLISYDTANYKSGCWYGLSSIRQFHKSIWHCHVYNKPSVYDAWYDDELLKKSIANRLVYIDNVDPSKVLQGFNISKIAPKVSVFNPVLAKYLISKYLNNVVEIFDPFSGFSGRLLGSASLGKSYIGQDIRAETIEESKQLCKFHNIDVRLKCKDIFSSRGEYESLFTCPPYGNSEIYLTGNNQITKSCDEWIDIIISRFKCKYYLFVVDKTYKYKANIVEELKYQSHFRKSSEFVICLTSSDLR